VNFSISPTAASTRCSDGPDQGNDRDPLPVQKWLRPVAARRTIDAAAIVSGLSREGFLPPQKISLQ